MRVHRFTFIAVAAFLIASSSAMAQFNNASTSANATARIITPISIVKVTDLNFGDVVAGGTLGTVVLTPAGGRTSTGGTTLGNAASVAAASFTVSGQASAAYSISLPASATIINGANNMTVNAFTSNPSGSGTLTGGTQALAVGATLNVGASQATGTYTGTFSVTVTYN